MINGQNQPRLKLKQNLSMRSYTMVVRIGQKITSEQTGGTSKEDVVQAITSGVSVVLDFSATWCGPCKTLYPCLVKLAEAFPDVHFYKLDVDQEEDEEFMGDYNVSALPTLVLLRKGQKAITHVGFHQEKLIEGLTLYLSADKDSVDCCQERIQTCFALEESPPSCAASS